MSNNTLHSSVQGLDEVQYHIDLIHERVIVRLRLSLPDGKLQKEERALCFIAGLLWTMAKGEEYSKDSHDTETILAHDRVDKPSKRFYQL